MASIRFLCRFVGMMWLLIGILFFVISAVYLIATILINDFVISLLPEALTSLIMPIFSSINYTLQQVMGVAFGVFCLFFGFNLANLKSWTRSIGVVFHLAMGVCMLALTVALYARMTSPGLLQVAIPNSWPTIWLVIGSLLTVGFFGVGFMLSTASATEVFSGVAPRLPAVAPVKCPTCGGLLDIEKGQCARCDNPTPVMPRSAKLISIHTNKEYPVSTRRITRIGRDMPGYEIQLEDRTVSGEHALIEYYEGHFILHALKDSNGTFVNDMETRIRDAEIKNEDRIAFGHAQFNFVVE